MTAQVIPLRKSAGSCNSGTVPGGISPPCGRTDTRLFACGPRCPEHEPVNRREAS